VGAHPVRVPGLPATQCGSVSDKYSELYGLSLRICRRNIGEKFIDKAVENEERKKKKKKGRIKSKRAKESTKSVKRCS